MALYDDMIHVAWQHIERNAAQNYRTTLGAALSTGKRLFREKGMQIECARYISNKTSLGARHRLNAKYFLPEYCRNPQTCSYAISVDDIECGIMTVASALLLCRLQIGNWTVAGGVQSPVIRLPARDDPIQQVYRVAVHLVRNIVNIKSSYR